MKENGQFETMKKQEKLRKISIMYSFHFQGLMLLETYTTLPIESLKQRLPEFLNIGSETTGDPAFSMFNLSLKDEWVNNKKFCHRLSDDDGLGSIELTQQAKDRLDANKSRQSSPTGEWCILN